MAHLLVEVASRHYKARKHRLRDARRLPRAQVVGLSAPKSGRTWLRALLSRLYQQRYGMPERELLEFDNYSRLNSAIPAFLFSHEAQLLAGVERGGAALQRIGAKKLVLLARNPIDVAVSWYFHLLHRTWDDRRRRVRAISMFDFMLDDLGLPTVVPRMNGWWRQIRPLPARHLIHYEALRARPGQALGQLLQFLGEGFSLREIDDAVEFARFENLARKEAQGFFAGRRIAATDPSNPDSFKVRRGKVDGYRDYFDAGQCAHLESWVAARLDPELDLEERP